MTEPDAQPDSSHDNQYGEAVMGNAMRWSIAAVAGIIMLAAAVYLIRGGGEPDEVIVDRDPITGPGELVQEAAERPAVAFRNVTAESGIDFVHESGARGEKLLPETMGSGAALFDYDNDGDIDVLLLTGTSWPNAAESATPAMRLYANDGAAKFTDVTTSAGLDHVFYGVGIAVGDYDGDGDRDLFCSALGANRLYRNDGGRFVDVTDSAGVAGDPEEWNTSAGFFDADGDGDLDLFVCTYVQWSAEIDRELNFSLNGVDRSYGPPKNYRGTDCRLYRNNGDGRFDDVTEASGIAVRNPATNQPMAKALAVTFVDIDGDHAMDILVANDTVQNFLFRNRGDGTFEEIGGPSGVGFDGSGQATGAMGIDVADYTGEGYLGIGIGNFARESTSFYVQQPDVWQFADMANSEGIGSPSRLRLSFGLQFVDYDLDGRLDLVQANGHLEETINEIESSQHYEQAPQLFWNCGAAASTCFAAVPETESGALGEPIVGRGVACADLDGDGDDDILFTQTGRPAVLLRNEQNLGHHWLRVRLDGGEGNREGIGAWVSINLDGVTQRRQIMSARSYLSAVPAEAAFGLGTMDDLDQVIVTWPDGEQQVVPINGVDRVVTVTRPSAPSGEAPGA